jgi:hypothetical protein
MEFDINRGFAKFMVNFDAASSTLPQALAGALAGWHNLLTRVHGTNGLYSA